MSSSCRSLPEEIVANILSQLALPPYDEMGEMLNYPFPSENYTMEEVVAPVRELQRCAEPVLYQKYPGQSMADPWLFLAALTSKPGRALLVEEMIVTNFVTARPSWKHEDWYEPDRAEKDSAEADSRM
ncbi:hypothetical protein Slin15195_G091220 [Septoria linicola]|uniref:Uncharacterized protein n=1 Tax=Septoria linicola TaxID=215465 RepID=A0A9Q9ENT7_9PEZI|nr:hypothetical protein Slin15195_G091220 [Septoria linicola]